MPSGYESHFPVLAALVARTRGPVLELGAGDGSTPMLHYMMTPDRLLLTADNDHDWLLRFGAYASPAHHELALVEMRQSENVTTCIEDWLLWPRLHEHHWSVAFIDCAPGEARHELAIRLAERAEHIICHDSETDYASGGNYQYEKARPHFKHVTEFRRFRPYTLVMSNTTPFSIKECDRIWHPPPS